MVEATGQPEVSVQIAVDAMRRGLHVAMVSKETDSVVGPQLSQLARLDNYFVLHLAAALLYAWATSKPHELGFFFLGGVLRGGAW